MQQRVAQQIGQVVERVAHELLEVVVVERVELHELALVGLDREPVARQCSERRTSSSNSRSDSGSRQPASRTATNAAPPAISAAATITPSARSSSARTAPIELNP